MKIRSLLFVLLALSAACAFAQPVALAPKPALAPLYSSYHAGVTDNFYTIKPQDHAIAKNTYAYADTGILAYMEKTQQPNTKPFKRFYKGAPQYEHFYTAYEDEVSIVQANGYQYEGPEGYIYTIQVPGTVPMYRIAKFNGYTGDLVHKYTLNSYEVYVSVYYQGWTSDGVQGYVYTKDTPEVPYGTIMGLRCPEQSPGYCGSGAFIRNYRDYYFGSLSVPSTPKTGTTQRMRFNLLSWDFFPTYSDSGSNTHLAFTLHGQQSAYYPNVENACPSQSQIGQNCSWHRGLGMILFGNSIAPNAQNNPWPYRLPNSVFTESWWVSGNDANRLRGADQTGLGLVNGRTYAVDIRVNDNGYISYSITDTSNGSIVKSDSWNASGQFANPSSPFPAELTGYAILDANGSQRDYTVYITGLSVDWL
jgi:hypothetical protein